VPVLLWLVRSLGVAAGLAIAGCCTTLCLLPLIAFVLRHKGPAALGLHRDGDAQVGGVTDSAAGRASDGAIQSTAGSTAGKAGGTVGAAPRLATAPIAQGLPSRRAAWLLWSAAAAFALGLMVQIGFATHHVKLALSTMSLADAGWLVSATGLMGFVGRLVLARIADTAPVRWLAAGALCAQVLALWAIVLWPVAPVIWGASLVYGYCVGHVTTLGPIVVRREFGAAAFGTRYGKAAMLIQFTSAMGPAFMGFMRDAFEGYGPVLALSGGLNLVAVASLIAGHRIALSHRIALKAPGSSAKNP
jgi:hypothetical protein